MIAKYQKEQTVTRLKKVYSSIAQTTQKAIADYGPIKTWELGQDGTTAAAIAFANKYLIPYLQVSKNCGADSTGSCKFEYKSHDNTYHGEYAGGYNKIYLSDGTLLAIGITNTTNQVYARIYIDINGPKKPNTNGKDIFYLNYYLKYPDRNGKLMPLCGTCPRQDLISYGCAKNYGFYCMRLIMLDNWQISDDYPSW